MPRTSTPSLTRAVNRALELRDEIIAARLGRRDLARLGLVAGSAWFAGGASLRAALAKEVASPRTTPWAEPLPVPAVLKPKTPMPAYDHAKHQHCRGVFDPRTYLELPVRQAVHRFHPALPASTI